MTLANHAELERALARVLARLKALDAPAPDPHGDDADQRTARQNVEDLVAEQARLHVAQGNILAALVRIDRGEYGFCVTCLNPIAAKRLDAIPWAELCVPCAEAKEIREQSARDAGRPGAVEADETDGAGWPTAGRRASGRRSSRSSGRRP